MHVNDFDYELPERYIAQEPIEPRDASRLLHLDKRTGATSHHIFRDIIDADLLQPHDVLVMNNTRVIPARLQAEKVSTGGAVEILLLRQLTETDWRALVGGRRVLTDTQLKLKAQPIDATVIDELDGPERVLRFSQPINALLPDLGHMPLPPYIQGHLHNPERYQTVYSKVEGSAAAPTAGLHFTESLLQRVQAQGVKLAYCTLHIGLDTFQPVKADSVQGHKMHSEFAVLDDANATIINSAKAAGGRIIAVGTTSARTLETAGILSAGGDPSDPSASAHKTPAQPVTAFERDTDLFIYPGYTWRAVDAMITNFHLPKSTLLMMISAFAGRDNVLNAYEVAKRENYRFYSLGDAMFIA